MKIMYSGYIQLGTLNWMVNVIVDDSTKRKIVKFKEIVDIKNESLQCIKSSILWRKNTVIENLFMVAKAMKVSLHKLKDIFAYDNNVSYFAIERSFLFLHFFLTDAISTYEECFT